MIEPLEDLERRLVRAARARTSKRRRLRRRLSVFAVTGGVLVAASAASAISGEGPLADVLGVRADDATLSVVAETPGAPRGVVRVRGDDGRLYAFAAFHAKDGFGTGPPSICTTQTRGDDERTSGVSCAPPQTIATQLRQNGIVTNSYLGASHDGSLRTTRAAGGLVPSDVRRVVLHRAGSPPVDAKLSKPLAVSLEKPTRPATMRAFLAVAARDGDGAEWLGAGAPETLTVVLADGSTKRRTFPQRAFFPMTGGSPPIAGERMRMNLPADPAPWSSIAYPGRDRSLCTAAAPSGERLIKATQRQCSDPLSVLNAAHRYGAALYLSNPNPLRERGPRSIAVFGVARADATAVTIVNEEGRRFEAKLSRPWMTVDRRPADLEGIDGALRERLEALPGEVELRSYIASISVPPRPESGEGLRLEVDLANGSQLQTTAEGPDGAAATDSSRYRGSLSRGP